MIRLTTVFFLILSCLTAVSMADEILITGLHSVSKREVQEIIGGRLETLEKKASTAARAADAAFILESLLHQQGFGKATVAGSLNARKILLQVVEGTRQYFGDIHLQGVDKKDLDAMRQLFTSNAIKRQFAFAPNVPFLDIDVTTGLSYIQQEWQSRGFWSAKVEELSRKENGNGLVDFDVKIDVGKLHTIAPVTIEGRLHQEDFLHRILKRYEGLPASSANINEIRRKVIAFYRKRGFTEAVITLSGEAHDERFHTTLAVALGERYRLRKWHIAGLNKTTPTVIEQRFAGTEGKYYDANRTDRTIRKLLKTGAFSSAQVHIEKTASGGQLDATLQISEAKARSYSSYAGVETFLGPFFGVSYADRNLWGQLMQFNVGLEWSARGLLFDSRIADPYFLNTDVNAGLRFFTVNRDLDVYQKFESGLSADFTWQVTDTDTLLLFAATSYVSINNPLIEPSLLGPTDYNHNRARFTWTHERRNSKVNPTDGWFMQLSGEMGAVIGTDSIAYLLGEGQVTQYFPVKEIHHIALGLRAGMIAPIAESSLPVDLRYFLGGPFSVRSFPQRELGPRNDEGHPRGGEAYWISNVEYVHRLSGPLKAGCFLDVGTLSEKAADFGLSNIDVALGLGIRLDLPIGPVRLEYGHNLTPDNGEPSGAIHFAIGVSF